jgi:TolA-binding protein
MINLGAFMTGNRLRFGAATAALLAFSMTPAFGQQVSPEQRIDRLERQLRQVQRQVFPRGQPADTAGLSIEPAATQSSVRTIDARLNGLERQLAEILRQSEENGHRLTVMQAEIARMKTEQDERLGALERAGTAAPAPATGTPPSAASTGGNPPAARTPTTTTTTATTATSATTSGSAGPAGAEDPGEIAYDEGYQLWRAGKYDQAITSLRAFSSSFPRHRRASWANNLAGRSLLDKGEPRAAAEALLANYRGNPKGERAADSLYYLGQALMQLKQAEQACKAYEELEAVYGSSMREELRRLLAPAKADARCS